MESFYHHGMTLLLLIFLILKFALSVINITILSLNWC